MILNFLEEKVASDSFRFYNKIESLIKVVGFKFLYILYAL